MSTLGVDPASAQNKEALRRFYGSRDPARVKNVDPLFLRFDEDAILEACKAKYGTGPPGWNGEDDDDTTSPEFKEGRSVRVCHPARGDC